MQKYAVAKCTLSQYEALRPETVIGARKNSFGVEALVLRDKLRVILSRTGDN